MSLKLQHMDKETEDVSRTMIFVVFDIKTETYSEPYPSTRAAFDNFIEVAVNTHTNHDWHLYADDFIVYEYGAFENGQFHLYEHARIYNALSAYRKTCAQCAKESEAGNLHCKKNLKED